MAIQKLSRIEFNFFHKASRRTDKSNLRHDRKGNNEEPMSVSLHHAHYTRVLDQTNDTVTKD